MPSKAPEIPSASTDEHRISSVDFSGKLDSGELLTGTPTVTEPTGTITPTGTVVNTAALEIRGNTVQPGEAVQFSVNVAGVPEGLYTIDVSCQTDSTPAQTVTTELKVRVF